MATAKLKILKWILALCIGMLHFIGMHDKIPAVHPHRSYAVYIVLLVNWLNYVLPMIYQLVSHFSIV
jgi:hypothetical protein